MYPSEELILDKGKGKKSKVLFPNLNHVTPQIIELSKNSDKNQNQLIRWVMNKEHHADEISEMALKYFLAQRIKFPEGKKDENNYASKLKLLHQMIVYSMKVKQTTDIKNVEALSEAIAGFKKIYFSEHKH